LHELEIDLAPLNVLIGPNGVGKSSMLDIMDLLSKSAVGKLADGIASHGGLTSLLTADGATGKLQLELIRPVQHAEPICYRIEVSAQGPGFTVSSEELTQLSRPNASQPMKFLTTNGSNVRYFDPTPKRDGKPKGLVAPNWDFNWLETALSQVPKMFRDPESFRQLLASSTEVYHSLDVSSRAPIRLPQSLQPAATPGRDGEHLFSCLYGLREDSKDRYDAIQDALRAAFPTFEYLELPLVGAGTVTLRWKDQKFRDGHYPNQLSEGTLRFLWLTTLLKSPGLPKVTLIDEPEISLHPRMLQLLAELMREASERTQLIIATHSDRLVRFLKPHELITCSLDESGYMTAQRANDLNLEKWLADYALDELWTLGRLEPQL
jgi:predicted ATPase